MTRLLAISAVAAIVASSAAFAQDKKADASKKAPTAQQQRMKDCNEQARDKKGEERQKFMSTCLRGGSAKAEPSKRTAQQERMASCNKEAGSKKLKGDERKKFMSECLKG